MISSTEGDQAAQFLYQPHHQRHQAPVMRQPGYTEVVPFSPCDRHSIRGYNRQARNPALQIRQDHGYVRYQSEQPFYYHNNNPQRYPNIR